MTKIKLCGLTRLCDIEAVNALKPEYIGFVFAPGSKRYIDAKAAAGLKKMLHAEIQAVGVFVNEPVEFVAGLLRSGIIDMAQLHGGESETYIAKLKKLSAQPVIKAFRVAKEQDLAAAQNSPADYVLLDSGAGTGRVFDWQLIQKVSRPYFLAGGLTPGNVAESIRLLHPYAVDVSSGIETGGIKDNIKMAQFVSKVRETGPRRL